MLLVKVSEHPFAIVINLTVCLPGELYLTDGSKSMLVDGVAVLSKTHLYSPFVDLFFKGV